MFSIIFCWLRLFYFLLIMVCKQSIENYCFVVCFNSFKSFDPVKKFLSFHSDWSMNSQIFVILFGSLTIFLWFSATIIHTENTYHIYVWSTMVKTYLMALIEQYVDIIKHKTCYTSFIVPDVVRHPALQILFPKTHASDWKSSSLILSVLKPIIISQLYLNASKVFQHYLLIIRISLSLPDEFSDKFFRFLVRYRSLFFTFWGRLSLRCGCRCK